MEIQKLGKIYTIERPINSCRVMNDVEAIKSSIAPGVYSDDQLKELMTELDDCIIDCCVTDDVFREVVMGVYEGASEIPSIEDAFQHIMEYNYTLQSCVAEAAICVNLSLGNIKTDEYISDYNNLIDEYITDYYDMNGYIDIDHMLYDCGSNNCISVSPALTDNTEYLEYSGMDMEDVKFIKNLNTLDDEVNIYTNDCQVVLIPELTESGCVSFGYKELGYYPEIINEIDKRLMIGG